MVPRLSLDLDTIKSKKLTSVRSIYIQNLADLVHVCILRGELDRARRGWAILVRCREVDWKSKWNWGLYLLAPSPGDSTVGSQYYTQLPYYLDPGHSVERYLKSLQVSAAEADKPMMLHALVLHLIQKEQYRAALEELDTYLPSYPYLLSGPLHTYAGMLAFYLAQPQSSRCIRKAADPNFQSTPTRETREMSVKSETSEGSISGSSSGFQVDEPVHPGLIRQAKVFFTKALSIDPRDEVASEFIHMIDSPFKGPKDSDDEGDHQDRLSNGENDDEEEDDIFDEEYEEDEEDLKFDKSVEGYEDEKDDVETNEASPIHTPTASFDSDSD